MRVNMCVSIIVMEMVFLIGAHVEAEQVNYYVHKNIFK